MALLTALIALTVGAALGQKMCKNDSNILFMHKPPIPGAGTMVCDVFYAKFFAQESAWTRDKCFAAIDVEFAGVPGAMKMPVVELQNYLATMGGCCGDDGSYPCQDHVQTPPCSDGLFVRNGICQPCFGKLEDGECRVCFGGDPTACSREECPGVGGTFTDEKGCQACNGWHTDGCDATNCGAAGGGRWVADEQRCWQCRPQFSDVEGCSKEQCEGAELKAQYPMMNWMCENHDSGKCQCHMCELSGEGGNWHHCTEEQCKATADFPDVKWQMFHYADGTTKRACTRCFKKDHNWDERACMTYSECVGQGFAWKVDCPTGDACCGLCQPGEYKGCQSSSTCMENGGAWCGDKCESYCPIACDHAKPIPHGECNLFRGQTSPHTNSPLTTCGDVDPWQQDAWQLEITIRMPNIDDMYEHEWLGLLGTHGGDHPYPYFGNGKFHLERQNGPHPNKAPIDVKEIGLYEGQNIKITMTRTDRKQWSVTFKDADTDEEKASVQYEAMYEEPDHFEKGPTVAGSGYMDSEYFTGTVLCVTFRGEMMPHGKADVVTPGTCSHPVLVSKRTAERWGAKICSK